MGTSKEKHLTFLICLLLSICFFVYRSDKPVTTEKPFSLESILGPLDGYKIISSSPLNGDIESFLELDDYTQTMYEQNGNTIGLYIGYYNSVSKISAAHSPVACYPAQGWTIGPSTHHQLTINEAVINFEEFVANLSDRQELLFYWFQAGNKTTQTPYINKINAILNNLINNEQGHAFVRVRVPIGSLDLDTARSIGKDFITTFYPKFLGYINSTTL